MTCRHKNRRLSLKLPRPGRNVRSQSGCSLRRSFFEWPVAGVLTLPGNPSVLGPALFLLKETHQKLLAQTLSPHSSGRYPSPSHCTLSHAVSGVQLSSLDFYHTQLIRSSETHLHPYHSLTPAVFTPGKFGRALGVQPAAGRRPPMPRRLRITHQALFLDQLYSS